MIGCGIGTQRDAITQLAGAMQSASDVHERPATSRISVGTGVVAGQSPPGV